YRLTVPGREAVGTWRRLRDLVPQTRHWPVLLGGKEEREHVLEQWTDMGDRTPQEILRAAQQIDPRAWLDGRRPGDRYRQMAADVRGGGARGARPPVRDARRRVRPGRLPARPLAGGERNRGRGNR